MRELIERILEIAFESKDEILKQLQEIQQKAIVRDDDERRILNRRFALRPIRIRLMENQEDNGEQGEGDEFFDALEEQPQPLSSGLSRGVSGLARGVSSGATGLAEGLATGATGLAQDVSTEVPGLAQGVATGARGLTQGVATGARGVYEALPNLAPAQPPRPIIIQQPPTPQPRKRKQRPTPQPRTRPQPQPQEQQPSFWESLPSFPSFTSTQEPSS